jgi:hypothetical protein
VLSGAGLVFILTSIRPTVSHDIISLVASSCGYYRGQNEHRAAHEFVGHVVTQRRTRETSTTPPSAARSAVAPVRERHCKSPRLTPEALHRSGTLSRSGHPGGAYGRSNDPSASPFHGMRCPPVPPLFASWPWLLHTECSLEALDMTVYERNHERGDSKSMRHLPHAHDGGASRRGWVGPHFAPIPCLPVGHKYSFRENHGA